MIIKRVWLCSKGAVEWQIEGWFLLGVIPIYMRDCGPRCRIRSWAINDDGAESDYGGLAIPR